MPAAARTCPPRVSRGLLLITWTTPPTALAPHSAEAGPRTTSTCSTRDMSVGANSHITKPRKSWYRLRPSARTRVEVLIPPVAEREAMFTTTIACVVTHVTDAGLLYLEGERHLKINHETEIIRLKDIFGKLCLREGRYTPGEIDRRWEPHIEDDFAVWLAENMDELPAPGETVQEYLDARGG